MEFSDALDQLKRDRAEMSPWAFIDGNHRGEALGEYARSIRSAGEEMIIVADDIHLNRGMYSAWSSLATPGAMELNDGNGQTQAVGLSPASRDWPRQPSKHSGSEFCYASAALRRDGTASDINKK